jgi:hypothetical protein
MPPLRMDELESVGRKDRSEERAHLKWLNMTPPPKTRDMQMPKRSNVYLHKQRPFSDPAQHLAKQFRPNLKFTGSLVKSGEERLISESQPADLSDGYFNDHMGTMTKATCSN